MPKGITKDPRAALSGLIAVALLGVLVIGGGVAVDGFLSRSWIQVAGGLGLVAGLGWMTWQAGRVARGSLEPHERP